jgi:Uma2 family endonuclease
MNRKSTASIREVYYPDSDGKPLGETPLHVLNFRWLLEVLEVWFAEQKRVFVAGNMFVYYEEGNPRRHVSPDVFVVRGIRKVTNPPRRRYLLWEEKPLDFVIELTSKSTRREDTRDKMEVYRDLIGVKEYFLYDPFDEYLHPSLQGFRLSRGQYVPIQPVDGRLPSRVTGLHLEIAGELLRLYDPAAQAWLPTPPEERAAREAAEEENARLRREIEELRRQLQGEE